MLDQAILRRSGDEAPSRRRPKGSVAGANGDLREKGCQRRSEWGKTWKKNFVLSNKIHKKHITRKNFPNKSAKIQYSFYKNTMCSLHIWKIPVLKLFSS